MTEATSDVPGVEDPAFMVTMFEALGIPRLRQALDEGTVGRYVGDDDLERYCRVAAVRSSGLPVRVGGEDGHAATLEHLGLLLATVLSGDGPGYSEIDGEPHVRIGDGPPVRVTDGLLRHWQWLWCILRDDRSARDLLAAAPAGIRERAEGQASTAWSDSFETIVAGFGS